MMSEIRIKAAGVGAPQLYVLWYWTPKMAHIGGPNLKGGKSYHKSSDH